MQRTILAALLLVILSLATGNAHSEEDFPQYQSIRTNTDFWEKIYATYSQREAVIHDQNDLSKIYSVLKLRDQSKPGADAFNKRLREKALKKYRAILSHLANHPPRNREEKRIAAMFPNTGQRKKLLKQAASSVRIQTGLKERFREGVTRSGEYMITMKKIFRSAGMPEDLAYLPHVESSFNPKAYSKFGAAGIWQFTRSTGKQFLQIDEAVDERLDPIAATRAAALYLNKSYGELGSWPLALTSYNYGLPGMLRAVEIHRSYEKIFRSYRKGRFKFASKNFYSEFLAARKVAKHLEKNGRVKLARHSRHLYMTLKGYVSLADLCRHFRLSPTTISALNPALRRTVLRGEKYIPRGYQLHLPNTTKVSTLISSLPPSIFRNSQRPSRFHRVKAGETASGIAARYGISLKALIKANNLDQYTTIYVRQKLKIPGRSGPDRPHSSSRGSGHLVTFISAQKKTFAQTGGETGRHTTRPLVLQPDKQKRKLNGALAPVPVKDSTMYAVTDLYRTGGVTYGYTTIRPEETLALFGRWLSLPPEKINSLNNLLPRQDPAPGQRLLLSFTHVNVIDFVDNRLDFLQETEDDFFATYRVIRRKHYKVVAGDTLWKLCYSTFDIPLWLLERYNTDINLSRLNVGQQLTIPVIRPL